MFVSQLNPVNAGLSAPIAADPTQGVSSASQASDGLVGGFAAVLGSTFSSLGQGLTTESGNLPEGAPLAQQGGTQAVQSASTQNLTMQNTAAQNAAPVAALTGAPTLQGMENRDQNSDPTPSSLPDTKSDTKSGLPPASQPIGAVEDLDLPVAQAATKPTLTNTAQPDPALQPDRPALQPGPVFQPESTDLSQLNQLVGNAQLLNSTSAEAVNSGASKDSAVPANVTASAQKPASMPVAENATQSNAKPVAQAGPVNGESTPVATLNTLPTSQASNRQKIGAAPTERAAQSQQSSPQLPAGIFRELGLDKSPLLNDAVMDRPLDQKPAHTPTATLANPATVATATGQEVLAGQSAPATISADGASGKAGASAFQSTSAPAVPVSDIAVHMVRNKDAGNSQFTIRLTPERMGTVTVTLNISKDAGVTGVLQVEKPETLALLQKDMAQLEKTLKAQGLDAKAGSFTLVLKTSTTVSKAVDGLANLANGSAAETASGFDAQAKAAGQNSAGQNSTGQNSTGQNSNNPAAGSQQANAGQPTNAAQGFDKSLGNAALPGDEQGFQQSSQERSHEQSQEQSGHMHSSPEHGQQNHDADAEAEPLERNDNEVPEIILSAYAARNMQVNMSARLDLSI